MDVPFLPPVSNEDADESTSGIPTYSEHHVDSSSKDGFLEKDDNSIDWDRERGRGQISNAWYGRGLQWFHVRVSNLPPFAVINGELGLSIKI